MGDGRYLLADALAFFLVGNHVELPGNLVLCVKIKSRGNVFQNVRFTQHHLARLGPIQKVRGRKETSHCLNARWLPVYWITRLGISRQMHHSQHQR